MNGLSRQFESEEHADGDFGAAQERNMRQLLTAFPPPPAHVLDVGCGIGGTSVALAANGYRVTAFAPDRPLIDYANAAAARRGAASPTGARSSPRRSPTCPRARAASTWC